MTRWRAWLVAGALVPAACAVDAPTDPSPDPPSDPSSSSCGPLVNEPLDPASAVHLLPGAAEPTYASNPPTSGPHLSGRPPSRMVAEPLDRPTQVLLLETGGVLIQFDPTVDAAGRDQLAGLASDQVVVAPGVDLPAAVVATAWVAKQTCSQVDLDVLGQFVDLRRNQVSDTPSE